MAKPSNLRIEDVGAADARTDLNDILISIASLQTTDGSGTGYTGEPTTTYPNMLWYDSAVDILKMRSEADDAWIAIGTLNQVSNTFEVAGISSAAVIAGLGYTPVQQGGGTSQLTNKVYIGWDGSNLRAQVDASDRGPISFHNQTFGLGQSYQFVTRNLNTAYLNNTGRPIQVLARRGNLPFYFDVSSDGVSWATVGAYEVSGAAMIATFEVVVLNNWYYRMVGGSGNPTVVEIR